MNIPINIKTKESKTLVEKQKLKESLSILEITEELLFDISWDLEGQRNFMNSLSKKTKSRSKQFDYTMIEVRLSNHYTRSVNLLRKIRKFLKENNIQ